MEFSHPIAIVDDDPAVADSLKLLLETTGCQVSVFHNGDQFLENNVADMTGCVLLDVRMPGKDGLTVLKEAREKNPKLHFVMMSGHGDIPMAVKALKLGAEDFIEKPFQAQQILDTMEKACEKLEARSKDGQFKSDSELLLSKLTPREREITQKLAEGKPNKIVAFELGISIRTVETHRGRIMSKLGIRSLADLVKIYLSGSADN